MAFSFTQTSITARTAAVAAHDRGLDNGRQGTTGVGIFGPAPPREPTPSAPQLTKPPCNDRRAHNKDLDQAGKTKHERNRDLAYGPRRRVARPSDMVPGRLPIDEETKKSYPRGFVPGLHDKDEFGRRKFASVDPRMYSAPGVVDELRALIRKHIPENGFGRPSPSILFRARYALQQWMLEKLREEKANL